MWNWIKYGWPFILGGAVVFSAIVSIFGVSFSEDVGMVLFIAYLASTVIGAIYRYSKRTG